VTANELSTIDATGEAGEHSGDTSGSDDALDAAYRDKYGHSSSAVAAITADGALVDGTVCGSPAAAAVMTGGSVTSPDDLTSILARFRPGTTISVTWTSPSGKQATSSPHLTAGSPSDRGGSGTRPARRTAAGTPGGVNSTW
jgi:S1-C subfamily serine protease